MRQTPLGRISWPEHKQIDLLSEFPWISRIEQNTLSSQFETKDNNPTYDEHNDIKSVTCQGNEEANMAFTDKIKASASSSLATSPIKEGKSVKILKNPSHSPYSAIKAYHTRSLENKTKGKVTSDRKTQSPTKSIQKSQSRYISTLEAVARNNDYHNKRGTRSWTKGDNKKSVNSSYDEDNVVGSDLYSQEMNTRIRSALYIPDTTKSLPPWRNYVTSLLTPNITSELIFNDSVFPSNNTNTNDAEADNTNEISGVDPMLMAVDGMLPSIHPEGHNLKYSSNVLQYSQLAHHQAKIIEKAYRRRHHKRLFAVKVLQRSWRIWHKRLSQMHHMEFKNANAIKIQQILKKSMRLQNRRNIRNKGQIIYRICTISVLRQGFRTFFTRTHGTKCQRYNSCQLWSILRKVVLFVGHMMLRRKRIIIVQGMFRQRAAKRELALLQMKLSDSETARQNLESAYVNERLTYAIEMYYEYLVTSSYGKQLVKWQMKKPFLRFRRLSKSWFSLPIDKRVATLCSIFRGKTIRGIRLRAVCISLLDIHKRDVPPFLEMTEASVNDYIKAIQHKTHLDLDQKQYVKPTYLSRLAWKLIWNAYRPRYIPTSTNQKLYAIKTILRSYYNVLHRLISVLYREISSNNAPRYACQYCDKGFGVCHEYYNHLRGTSHSTKSSNDLNTQTTIGSLYQCTGFNSYELQLIEWDEIEKDMAYITMKRIKRWQLPKNLRHRSCSSGSSYLSAVESHPCEFYADFKRLQYDDSAFTPLQVYKDHQREGIKLLRAFLLCGEQVQKLGDGDIIPFNIVALVSYSLRKDLHPLYKLQGLHMIQWRIEKKSIRSLSSRELSFPRLLARDALFQQIQSKDSPINDDFLQNEHISITKKIKQVLFKRKRAICAPEPL